MPRTTEGAMAGGVLGGVWIMKPIGKAQGKGIFLFNKLSQISDWKKDHRWKMQEQAAENYIVQRYIENPYLIGTKHAVKLYMPYAISALQWHCIKSYSFIVRCWT